jgi:hypothetical protein
MGELIMTGVPPLKKVDEVKKNIDFEKERVSKLKEAYDKFLLDDSYLPLYEGVKLFSANILVRVFVYFYPFSILQQGVKGTEYEKELEDSLMHATSFAKVLAVGDSVNISDSADVNNGETKAYRPRPGDILRIQDHLALSIPNPDYEAWEKNGLKKSNAKQIGEPPPKIIQPIRSLIKYMYVTDPLKFTLDREDKYTLLLPQSFFTSIVKKYE